MKKILDIAEAKFQRSGAGGETKKPKDQLLWEACLNACGLDLLPSEARGFLEAAPDQNHRLIPNLRVIAARDAHTGIFDSAPDPHDDDELIAREIPQGLRHVLAWRLLEKEKRIVILGGGIPTPSEPPIADILQFLHNRGYHCASLGGTPGFIDVALFESGTTRVEIPSGDQVELLAVQAARRHGRVVERPDFETIPEPDIEIVQRGMRAVGYVVVDLNAAETKVRFS